MLSSTEAYYRYQELNKYDHRQIKKMFNVINYEAIDNESDKNVDKVCSICCDDMVIATQLTCDGKHRYHKECI